MRRFYAMIFLALAIGLVFAAIDTSAATTTTGYRTEKTITESGGTISIKGINYDVTVGNKGNRIKLERMNYSTYMSYPSCKTINDTEVCFIQNLTKGSLKISINPKYGKLDYKIKRSIAGATIQTYVGQQINITVNMSNTGNMTIFPRFIDPLSDFFIFDCDNCRIENNKVIFNKSIEPDEMETFSYKIISEKKFKKSEKTPAIEFYDGVEKKTPKMEKIYYESLESFLKIINISIDDPQISDRANITVFINNTLKDKKMNYTISIDVPKQIEVMDSSRFLRDSTRYYLKGTVKNASTTRARFEVRFRKTGINTIPVTLTTKNSIVNYERTYNLTENVSFDRKPTIVYRMKEYSIGENSPHTLQVFIENQADFKLKNISVKLITFEKNYTARFPEVESVDEVADFDFFNASGKKIVMINTTYYTEFGEMFWNFDTKEMLFPEKADDKTNTTIIDTSNKNLTPDIKKNSTNTNSNAGNPGQNVNGTATDVPVGPDQGTKDLIKGNSMFILLGFVPLAGLIIFIIIGRTSSSKAKKAEENAEKELIFEIEKLKNEIEEREKDV